MLDIGQEIAKTVACPHFEIEEILRSGRTMENHNLVFRYMCRFIKHFFLFSVGLATFYLLASIFKAEDAALFIIDLVKVWWLRMALGLLIAWICAAIFESVQ